MRSIGKIAAAGIAGAFVGAALALRAGFSELAESQKVAAQTRAVLKSTGAVANVSAKGVDRLATAISRMSGIDDEAIAAGENMLLTFTNIRNGVGKNNKIFDMATKATIDVATALGRDIPTTAIMVGKALNDLELNTRGNITGWSALRRVGVKVTADMMKQAAAFIRAGKPMEAQKLLLRELMTEFGGSARAFGTTMPGALGKLGNAFDELTAAFAQGFLPIILKVANALTRKMADPKFVANVQALGTLIGTTIFNAFNKISSWFGEHWGQIKEGFRVGAGLAGGLAKGVQGIARAFQFLLKLGMPVFTVIIAQIKLLLALISGLARAFSHLPFIGGKFAGVAEAIDKVREGVRVFESGLETAANANLAGGGGRRRRRRGGERLRGLPRQHGGSVMPGVAYRVGERGPETFVPAMAGSVLANGASGVYIAGDVHLHNVQNARQLLDELQRLGRRSTAQRRGRHGGHNLALT